MRIVNLIHIGDQVLSLDDMPDTLMRDSNTYKNAVRFGLAIPNKKPVVFYFEKSTEDCYGQ